ncbi:ABC transporter permease [Nocardia callitridis]|uniref:ABC transporter permease n=1 Tax=Nocardia callitridis TaxID=648753 RepID=UPI003CD07B92
MSFHLHGLAWIPRTLRRYRGEVIRLVAEVSMGTGALAVIGGTIVIVGFLTAAAGYEVGQQGSSSLGRVGVEAMSGFISAFFNTREAIPVVAGVALTATVGAGFTAQLGAMRVSEEIDALEVMSIPAVPYLVTTRILAGLIAIVPLYFIALFMGYASTQFVSVVLSGLRARGRGRHPGKGVSGMASATDQVVSDSSDTVTRTDSVPRGSGGCVLCRH